MALDTDFLDLYAALGLKPDCSLDAFQRAYRRRVSALHPDRHGNGLDGSGNPQELQALTARYRAAMHFYRQHGRLPGGLARPNTASENMLRAQRSRVTTQEPGRRSGRRAGMWLLLVLIGSIVVVLWKQPDGAPEVSPPPSVRTEPAGAPAMAMPDDRELKLSLPERQVRSILGVPDMIEGDRWDYGPSWVRFENGAVVDWYSSPLHPLNTPSSTPAADSRP